MPPNATQNGKYRISTSKGIWFVEIANILYCHGENNYAVLTIAGEETKTMLSKTLKTVDAELTPHGFFRVHKAYLINLAHVKEYLHKDGGMALLNSGDKIPFSRSGRRKFLKVWKGR